MAIIKYHLHQQQPNDEARALAVAHLPIVQRICFHHVKQCLLAKPILLLEEIMLRIGTGDVSSNHFLAGTGRFDVFRVLLFVSLRSSTEQLPNNGPEMVGDSLAYQLLHRGSFPLLTGLPVGHDAGPCRPDVLLANGGPPRVERYLTRVGTLAAVRRALERVETLRVTLDQFVCGLQFC